MNERIKQLAKQANIEFTYDPTETPMRAFAECWEDELDKFAELVVRECIDVALAQKKWVEDQVVFDSRDVTWNKARTQQSQHIVNKIKEHFGIEE